MSNPGVLSLASLEPVGADYRFEIEDNIILVKQYIFIIRISD